MIIKITRPEYELYKIYIRTLFSILKVEDLDGNKVVMPEAHICILAYAASRYYDLTINKGLNHVEANRLVFNTDSKTEIAKLANLNPRSIFTYISGLKRLSSKFGTFITSNGTRPEFNPDSIPYIDKEITLAFKFIKNENPLFNSEPEDGSRAAKEE